MHTLGVAYLGEHALPRILLAAMVRRDAIDVDPGRRVLRLEGPLQPAVVIARDRLAELSGRQRRLARLLIVEEEAAVGQSRALELRLHTADGVAPLVGVQVGREPAGGAARDDKVARVAQLCRRRPLHRSVEQRRLDGLADALAVEVERRALVYRDGRVIAREGGAVAVRHEDRVPAFHGGAHE